MTRSLTELCSCDRVFPLLLMARQAASCHRDVLRVHTSAVQFSPRLFWSRGTFPGHMPALCSFRSVRWGVFGPARRFQDVFVVPPASVAL